MAQVCGEIARGGVKEVQGVPVHDVHHARPVPEEEVGRGRHGLTASDASGRDGALPVNRLGSPAGASPFLPPGAWIAAMGRGRISAESLLPRPAPSRTG